MYCRNAERHRVNLGTGLIISLVGVVGTIGESSPSKAGLAWRVDVVRCCVPCTLGAEIDTGTWELRIQNLC